MSAVRLIVVGLGARAQYWMRVILASPDCEIVGLVDPRAEARERAQAQVPGARLGSDFAAVAAAVDANAVLLCTPPHGREDQIAVACSHRLAILAEKPLADSVATAERYVEMAQAADVPLMVGLNFRYMAVTQQTLALFEGAVGAPSFARFTYERWRDGKLPHLNKYPLEMDQPMLWEQSIHHFDLMRYVYRAEPVAIYARTFNPEWSMYAHDANVSALISFDNGVIVSYQGTWAANWAAMGFQWRTECARGIVVQNDQFGALNYALRDDPELTPIALPDYEQWIDDAAALLSAFVRALKGEAALQCSGRDHLKSLRMVQACILSARSGQAINPADLEPRSRDRGSDPAPAPVME